MDQNLLKILMSTNSKANFDFQMLQNVFFSVITACFCFKIT